MAKKKEMTYGQALSELQAIVSELQDEMVSMDELSVKAKRAAELVRFCQEKLRSTEEDLKDLFSE